VDGSIVGEDVGGVVGSVVGWVVDGEIVVYILGRMHMRHYGQDYEKLHSLSLMYMYGVFSKFSVTCIRSNYKARLSIINSVALLIPSRIGAVFFIIIITIIITSLTDNRI